MRPRLSVLICSIYSRSLYLEKLLSVLKPQLNDEVELLVCKDNLETDISVKRNYLLSNSKGEYICYVDDDDLVPDTYISNIIVALESSPDCCGIKGLYDNKLIFVNSLSYRTVSTDGMGVFYTRTPNHLCPIKRDIAMKCQFITGCYFGEDMIYSQKILPFIKKEVFVDKIMYFYNCFSGLSEMTHDKVKIRRLSQIMHTNKLELSCISKGNK